MSRAGRLTHGGAGPLARAGVTTREVLLLSFPRVGGPSVNLRRRPEATEGRPRPA